MNQSFKTLQELAEEEAAYAQGSSQDVGRRADHQADHQGDSDLQSLRSLYYSAQDGTMGSRTSSLNTVQFEGIRAVGEERHEDQPHSPGRVLEKKNEQYSFEHEQGEEREARKGKEGREGSQCSILIQAAGLGTSSPDPATSPQAVTQATRDKDRPRRLLSEVESLHMAIMDTSADDGAGSAASDWNALSVDAAGCVSEEAPNLADEVPQDKNQTSDLEQEIEAQRKRIVELEGLVERYKWRVSSLGDDLELARQGQPGLDELEGKEKEKYAADDHHDGEDGEDGEDEARCDEHYQGQSLGQRKEEYDDDHGRGEDGEHDDRDGLVGDDHGDLDNGVSDEIDLVIEQLEEENRYLKVVYTERISHLVGENQVLRNQLLEAEQELLELDGHSHEENKQALAISVDAGGPFYLPWGDHNAHGHRSHHDHRHSLTYPAYSPNATSKNLSSRMEDHFKARESAAIGYSPLGAGRLLYW